MRAIPASGRRAFRVCRYTRLTFGRMTHLLWVNTCDFCTMLFSPLEMKHVQRLRFLVSVSYIFYCNTQKYNIFQLIYAFHYSYKNYQKNKNDAENEHRYESSFDLAPHFKSKIPLPSLYHATHKVQNSMYKKNMGVQDVDDYCICINVSNSLLSAAWRADDDAAFSSSAWAWEDRSRKSAR